MRQEANKREIILNVAQEIFSKYGFIKTTIDEIAKVAHVGKATLYHFFRNKEAIYKAVIEKENSILISKIKNAVKKRKTPQEKIKAFIITRMKCLTELANIYSVLKDEYLLHYAFIEEARKKNFQEEIQIIKEILNDGINKNIFSIKDVELTSFAIISALKGLEYPWVIEVPATDLVVKVDLLSEILLNGILKK